MSYESELEDLFDDVVKGDVFETSGYFEEGAYIVNIDEVKHFKSSQENKWWFLVVCTIMQTTCKDYAPGERLAWRVDRSKPSAGGNILQFMVAASSWLHDPPMDKDQLKENGKTFLGYLLQNSWEEEGAEFVLRADASKITTKAGKPFTKVTWSHPGEGLTGQEQAAE
jgi:hypothetical protein